MQFALDFPKRDRRKTRRAVRAYYAVYRKYKLLLEMDVVPLPQKLAPQQGYARAVDPDIIRSRFFDSREPKGDVGESSRERNIKWFVRDVEYKVSELPPVPSSHHSQVVYVQGTIADRP